MKYAPFYEFNAKSQTFNPIEFERDMHEKKIIRNPSSNNRIVKLKTVKKTVEKQKKKFDLKRIVLNSSSPSNNNEKSLN